MRPMPMTIRCPNSACGHDMSVPDNSEGMRIRCPHCRASALVPTLVESWNSTRGSQLKTPSSFSREPEAHAQDQGGQFRICSDATCKSANAMEATRCRVCNSFTTGAIIEGRYRVDTLIRPGGFGAVYRCTDAFEGDRAVAIKDMLIEEPHLLTTYKKFFEREAAILQALDTVPSVPRYLDYFPQKHTAQLVMEFIPGRTLLEVMIRRGHQQFPVAQVVEWGISICEVLEAMHNHRPPLIHRDVKPDNVMLLDQQNTIKMIDFGAARPMTSYDLRVK